MPSPINHYLLLISDVKSAGGYPSRPWVRRKNSPRTGHYSKKVPRLNQVQNILGLRGQPSCVPILLTPMLTKSPRPIHTATNMFCRKINIDSVCSEFIILNFILKVEKKRSVNRINTSINSDFKHSHGTVRNKAWTEEHY